jgi:hypothetical protein
MRPEGLCQRKIPIKPATFQFVAQYLNRADKVPRVTVYNMTRNIATSTNVRSWPVKAESSPVVRKSQYISLPKGVSISPTPLFSVTDLFQIRGHTKEHTFKLNLPAVSGP